jgi:hypothetical protein
MNGSGSSSSSSSIGQPGSSKTCRPVSQSISIISSRGFVQLLGCAYLLPCYPFTVCWRLPWPSPPQPSAASPLPSSCCAVQVPCGAAGCYLLGLVHQRTCREEGAAQHYAAALQQDPLMWSAYVALCGLGEGGGGGFRVGAAGGARYALGWVLGVTVLDAGSPPLLLGCGRDHVLAGRAGYAVHPLAVSTSLVVQCVVLQRVVLHSHNCHCACRGLQWIQGTPLCNAAASNGALLMCCLQERRQQQQPHQPPTGCSFQQQRQQQQGPQQPLSSSSSSSSRGGAGRLALPATAAAGSGVKRRR